MHALAGRGPEPVGQAHEKYKVESRGIEPLLTHCQRAVLPLDDDPIRGPTEIRIRISDMRNQCPANWTISP